MQFVLLGLYSILKSKDEHMRVIYYLCHCL